MMTHGGLIGGLGRSLLVSPRRHEKEEPMNPPMKPLRGKLDEAITTVKFCQSGNLTRNRSGRRLKSSKPRSSVDRNHETPEAAEDGELLSLLLSVSKELVHIQAKKERKSERKEHRRNIDFLFTVSQALSEIKASENAEEPPAIKR